LRIAYLNPSGQLGGAETSLREMLASVRASAPDFDLWLILGQDGPLAKQARDLGVQVVVEDFPAVLARLGDSGNNNVLATLASVGRASGQIFRYRRRLSALLESIRPDIIHSNGLKMHVLGAMASRGSARLIWHIHDYVSARRAMRHLLPRFRRACHRAIVNSNSVGEDFRRLLPGLKVTTIHNAVNVRQYSPDGPRLDLDRLAGLPPAGPGTLRVGLVATFARWKGHLVFLEAVARVPSQIPMRAYIVGGPIYQTDGSQWSLAELREQAERLGLAGKVGFTGFVTDTAGAMRSLDVVVHASTQPEPFGMVIIEGMASGRPVIAAGAGGAREIVADGITGLLHPSGDAAALARQMERLACDPSLRSKLGSAGRQAALQSYSSGRLAKELTGLYREVCDPCGRVAPACQALDSAREATAATALEGACQRNP